MELRYATQKLERICIDSREMGRRLASPVVRSLRLRIAELRAARDCADLAYGTGRWEQLTGDRRGQWSARLSANWRLIVEEDAPETATVLVVEIVDYHR